MLITATQLNIRRALIMIYSSRGGRLIIVIMVIRLLPLRMQRLLRNVLLQGGSMLHRNRIGAVVLQISGKRWLSLLLRQML